MAKFTLIIAALASPALCLDLRALSHEFLPAPRARAAEPASNKPSLTTASFSLKPTAGTTWNIQLNNVPSPDQANDNAYHLWDFDMADAPKSTIDAFHAKGRSVVCYFSAGSWEDYRSDANQFPKEALGKVMDGWEHEKWIDTRNAGVRNIMKARIQAAKEKGCDGIDPDVSHSFLKDDFGPC